MSLKTPFLQLPEAYFHIYNRGVNREPIFFGKWSYEYFLRQMKKAVRGFRIRLLAYIFMPNHYHLLLKQEAPYAMASFVKGLCEPHSKAMNLFLNRKGHLFEGGYKPKLVDDLAYLLHLSWYIHLNPVRAGFVTSPLDWDYSSCREYCGVAKSGVISTDEVLSHFGVAPFEEYRRFLEEKDLFVGEWMDRFTFRKGW